MDHLQGRENITQHGPCQVFLAKPKDKKGDFKAGTQPLQYLAQIPDCHTTCSVDQNT